MGEELYHQEAIVRETFEQASTILGYDMAELCFTENERLNQTEYTQPAILTVSTAFGDFWMRKESKQMLLLA